MIKEYTVGELMIALAFCLYLRQMGNGIELIQEERDRLQGKLRAQG